MQIVITIGPNKITNMLGRIRNALHEARKGLVKGWQIGKPTKHQAMKVA